jgi:flagellar protein FlaF
MKAAVEKNDYSALAHALHENSKLWMAFAIDVSNSENLLPDDLRARIVYLAEFTRLHTHKVLRKVETAVPLLEINAAIMRGLKQEGLAK